MKETGIIMSGSHPVDILEGKKTQTRRVAGLSIINQNPENWKLDIQLDDGTGCFLPRTSNDPVKVVFLKCPYGQAGSTLWCRETWSTERHLDNLSPSQIGEAATVPLWYKADVKDRSLPIRGKWRPSIFMPRWASRITLEITEIRVERLQEITEEDAVAEGVPSDPTIAIYEFSRLWDSLNGKKYPWASNPWVWVISFRLFPKRDKEVERVRE